MSKYEDTLARILLEEGHESAAKKVLDRAAHGLAKYGVSVERTDLTRRQWLVHAQEEAMDLSIYLLRMSAFDMPNALDAYVGDAIDAITFLQELIDKEPEDEEADVLKH